MLLKCFAIKWDLDVWNSSPHCIKVVHGLLSLVAVAEYGLHVLNEVGLDTGHEQGVAGQALLDGGGDVTSTLKD